MDRTPKDMLIGSEFKTNHGIAKLLQYKSATEVIVKFIDSGIVRTTFSQSLRKGRVTDPSNPKGLGVRVPNDIQVGNIFDSKRYGKFEILEYVSSGRIRIKFLNTGFETFVKAYHVRNGSIKDPYEKIVCGVACIGVIPKGAAWDHKKIKDTRAYKAWQKMIERCYDKATQNRQPTYKGALVCKEWLCFENFLKWFNETYPKDGKLYCLDKDSVKIGNKFYSPDHCIWLTRIENLNEMNVRVGNKRKKRNK
ncbi:hypothetical protein [Moritella sp. PE36]|uniref:hypothetical protein n=1 Tax=Moritella sp. PE36 TaxID=58051 RepID=UPI000694BBF8|nr:hypothetical protein [Moritella sp. PE36]